MAHVRQQVRERFATALTGIPGIAKLYSGRAFNLDASTMPAVSLMVANEVIGLETADRDHRRSMTVEVIISLLGGDDADDRLDDFAIEVENRVFGAAWEDVILVHMTGSDFVIGEPGEQTAYHLRTRFEVLIISDGPENLEAS